MTDASPIRVLLLEDHAFVRDSMRTALQMAEPRAEISEAGAYQEAMDLLSQRTFDIAFLDHDLGEEKTGFDILKHMREAGMETKAIMLSGRDDRETVMRCLAEGASGYISKAAKGEGIFRRALDTVFEGGVYLPSFALGKGGYAPPSPSVTAESLGVTGRQLEVLHHLCQGHQYQMIAWKMGISEHTVRKDYVTALLRRFNVADRVQLMLEMSRRGVVIPPPPERVHAEVR